MKNIWWLNHHANPPVVAGSTRHYSLAQSLQKNDYKVTIINGSFDHLSEFFIEGRSFGANLKIPLLRSYDGVDFCSIPTPAYKGNASIGRVKNMLAFYFGAMKYLRGKTDIPKPDLIIGSVVHPFAAYAGYRLSKYYNVPFVYEVRDLWPRTLVELGRISSKHPFVILLDKLDGFLAKKAKLIITTAPLMKNHYKERFGIPEEKCLWITNGTSFTKNTPTPMRRIGEDDVIEVGYTGTIGLANGIKEFLEELINVPKDIVERFNFTFIGPGPLKETLAHYAQENALPVEFKDSVPKDQVWDLLQEFDMFLVILLKSDLYKNGLSMNKMADYHAAAKPIVMIGTAAENPVLISGSGYVTEQMGKLSNLLKKILNDSNEQYELKSLYGRKYALEEYDWDKLALKLKNRLDSLF
jgi:glycosyltransferase involved in cell wall biosynthesis